MDGATHGETARVPPLGSRVGRWAQVFLNGGIALAIVPMCVLSYPLAASYAGRATPVVVFAVAAALLRRRAVPGLGWVRRVTARLRWFPVLRAPGIEALWFVLGLLYATFFGLAVPAVFRGAVAADELRVEDLVHGWKPLALGWLPLQRRLVALHGSSAEALGVSVVDVSGDPPVSRFLPVPWREDESPLTALGNLGLVLAHGTRSAARLTIDARLLAHRIVPEQGTAASAYDAETRLVYLFQRRGEGGGAGASSGLVAVDVDAYLRDDLAAARRYPLPEPSGSIRLAVDHTTHARVLVSGGRASAEVWMLDLASGAWRSVRVPPVHAALVVDGRRGKGYVTSSTRSSLVAIDLARLEVEREIWVGGVAGPIAVLDGVGAIAVGTQLTGELLLLDGDTLETRARLATCRRGDPFTGFAESLIMGESRDLAWDEADRAIYVADGCGVRRVRLPAGWCANASCASASAPASRAEAR